MGGYKYRKISVVYNESTDMADIRVSATCVNDSAPYFDFDHPLTTFEDAASFIGGTLFDNGRFLDSSLCTKLGRAVGDARRVYDSYGGCHDDIQDRDDYRRALESVYAEMLRRQKQVIERSRKQKVA